MEFLCLRYYNAAQFAALHPGAHAGMFVRGAIEIRSCEGFFLAETSENRLRLDHTQAVGLASITNNV